MPRRREAWEVVDEWVDLGPKPEFATLWPLYCGECGNGTVLVSGHLETHRDDHG